MSTEDIFPVEGLTDRALAAGGYWVTGECEFTHPHPDHPCGARTSEQCVFCDALGDCACWQPATQRDLDELICEAIEPGQGLDAVRGDRERLNGDDGDGT